MDLNYLLRRVNLSLGRYDPVEKRFYIEPIRKAQNTACIIINMIAALKILFILVAEEAIFPLNEVFIVMGHGEKCKSDLLSLLQIGSNLRRKSPFAN